MSAEQVQDNKGRITSTVATLLGYGRKDPNRAANELKSLKFGELSRVEKIIAYTGWQAIFGQEIPQEVDDFIQSLQGASDLTEEEKGWLQQASIARAMGTDFG